MIANCYIESDNLDNYIIHSEDMGTRRAGQLLKGWPKSDSLQFLRIVYQNPTLLFAWTTH